MPGDRVSGISDAEFGADGSFGTAKTYRAQALTADAAVGTAPSGPPAEHPDRAPRLAASGPRPFYLAAIISLAVTSLLAMTIAALVRPHGLLPAAQRHLIADALVMLCLAIALGMASLTPAGRYGVGAWLDRLVAPRERAAIWLAFAAWFPFLLVVVYCRAKATFPPPTQYVYYPYHDKRWVTAAYLLGVIAPAICLVTAARVLSVARSNPTTRLLRLVGLLPRAVPVARAQAGSDSPASESAVFRSCGARGWLPTAAGIATALGLAWYFLGPPWYISETGTPISKQEDVVLIGLQAVARGHLPYVGVASVQYGPGTQLAAYLLMRHVTAMSVVGFREAWALFVWAGASVLFVVFFLAFGYVRGLAASLLSELVYPALHEVAFQPHGSFDGYWGWANPLRYVGVIALVLLLPAVVRRSSCWHGTAAGVAVGALWGLTSYLAQENLAGGVVGALAVSVLLLFTASASWHAVCTALATILAGAALIWVPVLAFYVVHDQLAGFLRQYLLFPSAVAQGANDTAWPASSPLTSLYHLLPFTLAALALLAVVQVHPFRVATAWSRERISLLVTVMATALLYQGALLRSDNPHLTGTLLMVPALVVVTGSALPRLVGAQRLMSVTTAGMALIVASFLLLPHLAFAPASVRAAVESPYLDRQQLASAPRSATPATLAGRRVGPGLAGFPQCCQGSPATMPEFIALMNRVHAIIGDRTAYVAAFHGGYPGLVYFAADLNPAPVSSDMYSSIETETELRTYMADFRARVMAQTQAIFTTSLKSPPSSYFLRQYPNARLITLRFARNRYFILLRPG